MDRASCLDAAELCLCKDCASVSRSHAQGILYHYHYDSSGAYCSHNESTRVANHKKFPCVRCPNAISAIGNRLETPRKHDNEAWRDAMIHMLRVVEVSQSA